MIKLHDSLPSAKLQHLFNGDMITTSSDEIFSNKKVVLFAVPGAFTPTCSNAHLPGYVVNYDAFMEKGVDNIICLSVNDAFVMDAWGKSQNAGNILMMADGCADFTKALGLESETGLFGGIRSRRYAMIVENKVVTALNIEEPKSFKVSDAETILTSL